MAYNIKVEQMMDDLIGNAQPAPPLAASNGEVDAAAQPGAAQNDPGVVDLTDGKLGDSSQRRRDIR